MPYRIKKAIQEISTLYSVCKGKIYGNNINAYWWNEIVNFGDLITPFLLDKYNFTPIHSEISKATLVSTGSILQRVPVEYNGIILGSGFIENKKRIFKNAKILAVRGELSRALTNAPSSVVLGDPGLLMSKFIENNSIVKYKIGLIPHYVERDDPRIRSLKDYYKNDLKIINVCRNPKDVVSDILKCEVIVSSSLHGIVLAHSFYKNAVWIKITDNVYGNGFKFYDYSTSIKTKIPSIKYTGSISEKKAMLNGTRPEKNFLEMKIENLDNCFKLLKNINGTF